MAGTPIFGFVIPTLNAEPHIERLLRSILGQTQSSYAIAVVDQGSTDRTTEIARSFGCSVINVPAGPFYSPPGRNRNIGAQAVEGRILVHLDADMELGSPNFLATLEALIDNDHRAAVIRESDVAFGFWANCKALERSCYRGTEIEAARAVSRDVFIAVGGYDEDISSGEDLYVTGLYRRQTRLAHDEALWVWHHLGCYSIGSLLRKKFSYGRTAQAYLRRARTVGAASANQIARASMAAYLRNWRLIRSHPAQYVCIFPLRALEFIAVVVGMWVGGRESQTAT
ncbi:MAG TPA: glycosyltransferase family A protein [Candidatus Dormibacteraeota bacterium]|nr:glycosyltransferase family A protein [Candidatus Dormibacteraeota bacterium]